MHCNLWVWDEDKCVGWRMIAGVCKTFTRFQKWLLRFAITLAKHPWNMFVAFQTDFVYQWDSQLTEMDIVRWSSLFSQKYAKYKLNFLWSNEDKFHEQTANLLLRNFWFRLLAQVSYADCEKSANQVCNLGRIGRFSQRRTGLPSLFVASPFN